MSDETRRPGLADPTAPPEAPPPGVIGGDMNQRGGQVDIVGVLSKLDEAEEESFPASDATCHTPPGAYTGPPPSK
jgi:hypothetical protein